MVTEADEARSGPFAALVHRVHLVEVFVTLTGRGCPKTTGPHSKRTACDI